MGFEHTQQDIMKTMSDLWLYSDEHGLKCPVCQKNLLVIQANEIQDHKNPYKTYETIIECVSCSYNLQTVSYTILGALTSYDKDHVTITGWSPSGSRVETTVEHILDYHLLKELLQSEELVEFLIVDNHAIQVIG